MKIGICGLGYIGSVCAAGFCQSNNKVITFDIDKKKLDTVKQNNFSFPEAEVATIINEFEDIDITYSLDGLSSCDMINICVNTPLKEDGTLEISIVKSVVQELTNINYSGDVIVRSTLPFDTDFFDFLRNSGLHLAVVPEFLREGSALEDFRNGECLIIGTSSDGDKFENVETVLSGYFKKQQYMTYEEAVFTKLLNNTWHATKVAFANEWAAIAKDLGDIDVPRVHQAFINDTKLNLSKYYLRPGGPYGGPCLPKDISEFRSLSSGNIGKIITGVIDSNNDRVKELAQAIFKKCNDLKCSNFSFDSLEFKKGTGDERYSPLLWIIDILQKDYNLRYCKNPSEAEIIFSGRMILDQGKVERSGS